MWVTPLGSTLFERLVRKLSKKLVYDFDDAVHLKNSENQKRALFQRIVGLFRGRNKANYLIKYSDHVVVSSPFHVEYCKNHNLKKT